MDTASTTTTSSTTVPVYPEANTEHGGYALGISVAKISAYQAMETKLSNNGNAPNNTQIPLVAERDALVRVFLEPSKDSPLDVYGELTLERAGEVEVLQRTKTLRQASTDEKMGSTMNFELPSSWIRSGLEMRLALFDAALDGGGGLEEDATWSSETTGGVPTERSGSLEVVLIPIRYDADGSGRVPDTSEAQLQRYRDTLFAMYPVTDITIRVTDVSPWSGAIDASGAGWGDLLNAVSNARTSNSEAPNTYYYAIFEPAESMYAYCQWGCVAGLSYLANRPNDVWARASMGLGFSGQGSADTMVHEVGHAHGREHAPCGVDDVDRNYPHADGVTNVWGYHQLLDVLHAPEEADMMSYCSPIWISDYTYLYLFERIRELEGVALNAPGPVDWQSFAVDSTGGGSVATGAVPSLGAPGGEPVSVQRFDARGLPMDVVTGYVFPYSHVPGGRVLVPGVENLGSIRLLDPADVAGHATLRQPFGMP
jgi:hypothetical protein